MAEFNTKCPQCGMELTADDSLRGQQVTCPGCDKTFALPERQAMVPPPLNLSLRKPPKPNTTDTGRRTPPPPPPKPDHSDTGRRTQIGRAHV